jgi:hypothetical protein
MGRIRLVWLDGVALGNASGIGRSASLTPIEDGRDAAIVLLNTCI